MEDFKDVMLSEPPQRYGAQPTNTTSNALSLESYKGILLCDRPADNRVSKSQQHAPFLPPGNTDMDRGNGNLGLQPSLETRSKNTTVHQGRGDTQTRAKNTALSKHRKWLTSFASAMKQMKDDKTDTQIQQTVREAALRDREAQKRRGQGTLTNPAPDVTRTDSQPPVTRPDPVQQKLPTIPKSKKKPKWAMTEEEAEDAEFEQARDLMDFAAELDYDTFIKDFEVQEALAIMRDRVREIAEEKGIDIEAEREAAAADDTASVATASTTTRAKRTAVRKAQKAAGDDDPVDLDRPGWNDSTNTAIRKALQGDAMKLAERVLQTSDSLRKVHSKMSMAKLLEDVAMEVNKGKTQRSVALPTETAVIAPKIAMVAAEATGDNSGHAPQPTKRVLTEMRQSKTQTQNLPYLYRCPSI